MYGLAGNESFWERIPLRTKVHGKESSWEQKFPVPGNESRSGEHLLQVMKETAERVISNRLAFSWYLAKSLRSSAFDAADTEYTARSSAGLRCDNSSSVLCLRHGICPTPLPLAACAAAWWGNSTTEKAVVHLHQKQNCLSTEGSTSVEA